MDILSMTPKAKAELMIKKLLAGKEVAEMFDSIFENRFKVSGQPAAYWRKKFMMTVPADNLTPQVCRELDAKLMDLHHEATFFMNEAVMRAQMAASSAAGVYYDKFQSVLKEHDDAGRKRPAAQTLESISKANCNDLEIAKEFAQAESKFWKGILEHLNTCRKLIENATVNNSSERKAEYRSAYIEKVAERSMQNDG